jgi:hypothetical protein
VLPHDKLRLAALVADADRELLARRAFRSETAEWIRPNRGYSDGICSDALAVPWVIRHNASWQIARDAELAVNAALLVVVASEDDRVSLVRAGEALEELLLTITAAGLHYSFLNQPIIADEFRHGVQLLAGATRPAQLLLRIGQTQEVTRAMPRREVERVVSG